MKTIYTLMIAFGMIALASVGYDVGPSKTADQICNNIQAMPEMITGVIYQINAVEFTSLADAGTALGYQYSTMTATGETIALTNLHIDPGLLAEVRPPTVKTIILVGDIPVVIEKPRPPGQTQVA